MMELVCHVQHYDWGSTSPDCAVARLSAANRGSALPAGPHAELWMGAHPSGPSVIKDKGGLAEYLKDHPEELGAVLKVGELPFLFKVLSVERALSVQVHPNKQHAEELHRNSPELYKDDNHKPELAVALTEFQALCGFRPAVEIQGYLQDIRELRLLIGEELSDAFVAEPTRKGLKDCFTALMTSPVDKVKLAVESLLQLPTPPHPLLPLLHSQFPHDVGLLCLFFLNPLTLHPGQALYLPANEPHAYIKGDVVEIMANSDNVVRAGLTPKFRDVPTLCEMLSYTHHTPSSLLFIPNHPSPVTREFLPPVPDFALSETSLSAATTVLLPPRRGASLILVVRGTGTMSDLKLSSGSVVFVPASRSVEIRAEMDMLVYQAFTP